MDDLENENYMIGNSNRRLLFSSQLSQGIDCSQRTNSLTNELSMDRLYDTRQLSQLDFLTPAYNEDMISQRQEPVNNSSEYSGIFGETPQKNQSLGARSFFKRRVEHEAIQGDEKQLSIDTVPIKRDKIIVRTLLAPEKNVYLSIPPEIAESLNTLLKKEDFRVLNKDSLIRYQSEFKELQMLGKGVSSIVTLCKHRIDGCYYAIKQMELRDKQKKSSLLNHAKREVRIMSALNYIPNIIHYSTSWMEEDVFYIQMEYAYYGSLTKCMEKYTLKEDDVRAVLYDIAVVLKAMHSAGYAHLDVKPDNIMVMDCKEWKVKLSDFGLTCKLSIDEPDDGDGRYLPPELISTNNACKADVYALGVTVIQLLTPKSRESKDIYSIIRSGSIPKNCCVTPHLRSLLQNMINANVDKRYTMNQVVGHNYFDSIRNKWICLLYVKLHIIVLFISKWKYEEKE